MSRNCAEAQRPRGYSADCAYPPVQRAHPPVQRAYEGRKQRVAIVRQRGKRKDIYLDLARDDIVLDGWNQPFRTDTECSGIFAGNACYNLVGEPETIRQCIEAK